MLLLAPGHPGIRRHSPLWGPSFIRHVGCRTDHAGGKTQGEAVLSPVPIQSAADMAWGIQVIGSWPSLCFLSLSISGRRGSVATSHPPVQHPSSSSSSCHQSAALVLNSTRPSLEPGRSQLDPAHVLFFSFCIKKETLLLRGKKSPVGREKKSVCGHCGNHG